MKDKVYMVLAFIGFCILVVVVAVNYNSNNASPYEINAAYTPQQRTDLTSASALYAQMTGQRKMTCPATSLSSAGDSLIVLTSIWGSYYTHDYGLKNMFITSDSLAPGESLRPLIDDYEKILKLSDKKDQRVNDIKLSDLFKADLFESSEIIELVAPFPFSFTNLNSSKSKDKDGNEVQSIVITNSTNTCQITFTGVKNWFCAGEIGTTTLKGTGSDGVVEWVNHGEYHHSVIGNSANAVVRGGDAGDVIGYADSSTTITIKVHNGGGWGTISLKDFLLPH